MAHKPPVGIILSNYCCERRCRSRRFNKDICYRVFILLITFLCYTAYHLSRKPLSVVKNVLVQNCDSVPIPPSTYVTNENHTYWCNWPPFNVPDADKMLGSLDSCFLFTYAASIYVSGIIAERVDLRYFLSMGMMLSGVFTYMFGLGYVYQIHALWYYVLVQILCGIVQSTGWPSVVTCVSNWFGKGRRGFIFGIWNSHTSVGNILGSLIAGVYVQQSWGWSFMIPGVIIGAMGFFVFLFLVTYPEDVGCTPPDHYGEKRNAFMRKKFTESEEAMPILGKKEKEVKAISFMKALTIPGVVEYSLCLFFAKLVSYTFLYWLPRYINISTNFTAEEAANLSTLFDVGGIVGGIIAGLISDHSGASASTCMGMLLGAIPMLFLYDKFGSQNLVTNISLLMICGLLVNGPYALITTAVSAELGTHHSLAGNAKALATVVSIIDGTGSMGAAIGPLLAGMISNTNWENVFFMLMAADICAMLLLIRLVKSEIKVFMNRRWEKKRYMVA